jgi:hypothetical protein
LWQPTCTDEEGRQTEEEAIGRSQVWCAPSGASGYDELMLEQQRFGYDGANSAGSQEFGDRDDHVKRENEQIAHGGNLPHARIWIRRAAVNDR